MTALKIVEVPIEELHPDPNNARTHDAKNLAAIRGSLEAFGQVEPIVVQKTTGKILGGNGRFEVMKQLGWQKAKVVMVDLGENEATALALALNRTAELAGWDYEQLADLTQMLSQHEFNLESIGWTADDLSPVWAAEWKPPEPTDMDEHKREGSGEHEHAHSIRLTLEQREVFNRAAFRVREKTGDHEMTEGRCLELICADSLAGP